MKQYEVKLYQKNDYTDWNAFIGQAKNATFLFHRDFMEYHSDRFQDYSLIVLDGEKWVAVLPANSLGKEVFSHQGLTYGGLVYSDKLKTEAIEIIFDAVLLFLKKNQIQSLIIKPVLDFYPDSPSNELGYFFFQKKAVLLKRSMNLAIDYKKPLRISKSKMKHYRRISESGIVMEKTEDCTSFWNEILIPRLEEKHQTKPVHTLSEISRLRLLFPQNILQYNAYFEGEIVAGITLFCSGNVVKSQYGATSQKGESVRALDYLFINLIQQYVATFSFFDMGIVDEMDSYNKGLLRQKEELGCSVYLQDVYKINLL